MPQIKDRGPEGVVRGVVEVLVGRPEAAEAPEADPGPPVPVGSRGRRRGDRAAAPGQLERGGVRDQGVVPEARLDHAGPEQDAVGQCRQPGFVSGY